MKIEKFTFRQDVTISLQKSRNVKSKNMFYSICIYGLGRRRLNLYTGDLVFRVGIKFILFFFCFNYMPFKNTFDKWSAYGTLLNLQFRLSVELSPQLFLSKVFVYFFGLRAVVSHYSSLFRLLRYIFNIKHADDWPIVVNYKDFFCEFNSWHICSTVQNCYNVEAKTTYSVNISDRIVPKDFYLNCGCWMCVIVMRGRWVRDEWELLFWNI